MTDEKVVRFGKEVRRLAESPFQSEAQKLDEHDYRIWIDRRENPSIANVRGTLQHEACQYL